MLVKPHPTVIEYHEISHDPQLDRANCTLRNTSSTMAAGVDKMESLALFGGSEYAVLPPIAQLRAWERLLTVSPEHGRVTTGPTVMTAFAVENRE